MDDSKPVTAIISFRLLPGFRETWLEAWKELHDEALNAPGSREFRLLRDRHDETHCIVLTEWERASDFDDFMREAGVIWLERCLDGTSEPLAYFVLEAIPLATELATQKQTQELVPVIASSHGK